MTRELKQAIQIAEDLKGIDNQDNVIENVKVVAEYVIDTLESVVGSQRHMRSEHQNETVDFWKELRKQANNMYNFNEHTED